MEGYPKRQIGMIRRILRWSVAIAIVILIGASLPFLVVIGGFVSVNWIYTKYEERSDIRFDADLWKEGAREALRESSVSEIEAPRIRMHRDLIAREDLLGKKEEEILEVLGEPDNYPFREPWEFNYWLGPQRGIMKLDSEWLAIRFDDDGKAVELKVLRD